MAKTNPPPPPEERPNSCRHTTPACPECRPTCANTSCYKEAEYTVIWDSKQHVHFCYEHAYQDFDLASKLKGGLPVTILPILFPRQTEACHEHGCKNNAAVQAHWPGHGLVPYCQDHADKAEAIAGVLGFSTIPLDTVHPNVRKDAMAMLEKIKPIIATEILASGLQARFDTLQEWREFVIEQCDGSDGPCVCCQAALDHITKELGE